MIPMIWMTAQSNAVFLYPSRSRIGSKMIVPVNLPGQTTDISSIHLMTHPNS